LLRPPPPPGGPPSSPPPSLNSANHRQLGFRLITILSRAPQDVGDARNIPDDRHGARLPSILRPFDGLLHHLPDHVVTRLGSNQLHQLTLAPEWVVAARLHIPAPEHLGELGAGPRAVVVHLNGEVLAPNAAAHRLHSRTHVGMRGQHVLADPYGKAPHIALSTNSK